LKPAKAGKPGTENRVAGGAGFFERVRSTELVQWAAPKIRPCRVRPNFLGAAAGPAPI
jgi:hypothetical protein